MRAVPQRIAIVGGGAAGALAAVHLLREPRERGTLEIEVIDRAGTFGAGVAYGTEDPLHLLNVPAARMGALQGRPGHFHEWLLARGDTVAEESFLPRGLYATYIRDLLAASERDAVEARVRRRGGEVVAIAEQLGTAKAPLELTLADGQRVEADRVVLALGPLGAGDPIEVPAKLRQSGRYVSNPWAPGALDSVRSYDDVLIIGTGLTMVDIALSLGGLPDGPRVRAISRHGLVPRRHRRTLTNLRHFPLPTESGELGPIVAAVMAQVAHVSQHGDDWRDVIDSMRPVTPQIWKALSLPDKRRFLAELQRFWDVHRFRMAPDVADRLAALESAGRVSCGAGSIASLEPRPRGVRVYVRTVGTKEPEAIDVDAIVNCTGAGVDLRRQAPPLLAGLLAAGRARPDELGLGLDVAEDGALLDAEGVRSDRLFAVGALRKGVEWEAIGITEIRDHAGQVASQIVAAVERESGPAAVGVAVRASASAVEATA